MKQQNVFITCKEARIENNRSFYGCFNFGPFDSSESLTIANALRRTLLSECPGLGIISVMIENVTHEYSTINGMRESVLDLLLNLKEIVFRKKNNLYYLYKNNSNVYKQVGESYSKPISGFLKVKGPGVIRAKDLNLPSCLECVDPEQYIATLAEDGFLSMKFVVMEGKGYLLSSSNLFGELTNNENYFIDNKIVKDRLAFLKEMKDTLTDSPNALRSGLNQKEKTKTNIETEEIKKSKPLNLDTIFNPITKVSYMIEDFDNKIVDDLNKKVNFVNDITNLIESSDYLKTNLPFITKEFGFNNNQKKISSFVDEYSMSEIHKISSYLHPLKKNNPLHTVVLEIWTNGSLHPRDALYIALERLTSVFLNMKNTQSYNSMYVNEASFLTATQKTTHLLEQYTKATDNNLQYMDDINSQSIDVLNLALRPYTLLKRSNIHLISDLIQLSINDLNHICGFNKKYVSNIVDSLSVFTQLKRK